MSPEPQAAPKRHDHSRIAYWRKGEPVQNFGDVLTELFTSHLFEGGAIQAKAIHLIGSVISDDWVYFRQVGSTEVGKVVFWGCGLSDEQSLHALLRNRAEFRAVRGPLTRDALALPLTTPLGDPGLLLPAIYTPRPAPRFANRSVCIPHFHDKRSDAELLVLSGCDAVLRPNIGNSTPAILSFIDAVVAADFVLSASLHGAVTAVAFARPFSFWDNGAVNMPFKWRDFAASVAMPCRFQPTIAEARSHYATEIAPQLRIPALSPLLASAPLSVRPEVAARVMADDGRRRPADMSHPFSPQPRPSAAPPPCPQSPPPRHPG